MLGSKSYLTNYQTPTTNGHLDLMGNSMSSADTTRLTNELTQPYTQAQNPSMATTSTAPVQSQVYNPTSDIYLNQGVYSVPAQTYQSSVAAATPVDPMPGYKAALANLQEQYQTATQPGNLVSAYQRQLQQPQSNIDNYTRLIDQNKQQVESAVFRNTMTPTEQFAGKFIGRPEYSPAPAPDWYTKYQAGLQQAQTQMQEFQSELNTKYGGDIQKAMLRDPAKYDPNYAANQLKIQMADYQRMIDPSAPIDPSITALRQSLGGAAANPYVGLTGTELQQAIDAKQQEGRDLTAKLQAQAAAQQAAAKARIDKLKSRGWTG